MQVIVTQAVNKFIHRLTKTTQAKIVQTINLLEIYGYQLKLPYSRALGGGLFELRIRSKQAARLFYFFNMNQAIIVHGFIKKTQITPKKEIKLAIKKMQLTQRKKLVNL